MAAGTASPVAVLRDADLRSAPQDEVDGWNRHDSNFENALLDLFAPVRSGKSWGEAI